LGVDLTDHTQVRYNASANISWSRYYTDSAEYPSTYIPEMTGVDSALQSASLMERGYKR
jgi:hypothetical protein